MAFRKVASATYSNTLFEVESVEVLQGYHGHQFGKNSPGGVINVSSRKAEDTHRSKLYASYGSFNTQNIEYWPMDQLESTPPIISVSIAVKVMDLLTT